MELCSIASGSSGNCIYVGTKDTHLLVDAGISKKRIEEGLKEIKIDPAKLDGILITHEHSDHVSGLGVLTRRYQIPIYATKETCLKIQEEGGTKGPDFSLFRQILPDSPFLIKDIEVTPFSISHDAVNPVSFTFLANQNKIGIATDFGEFNEYIVKHLKNVNALLIEANHDVHMLQAGSYPYSLKRRILGEKGHLSNENSGILLGKIWSERLKYIFLGHLSKENNFPALALETVRVELLKTHAGYETYTKIQVAERSKPSTPVFISG